jgi:hypothetical protein
MLMNAPIMYHPIMATVNMTLPAVVVSPPVGQILNYTLEMFPSSGTRIAAAQFSFITLPSDTLSNQLFKGNLDKALTYHRSIVNGDGFGKASSGFGELQLNNAGSDYDSVFLSDTIDGRRVLLKYGQIDGNNIPASYDTYPALLDGIAQDWYLNDQFLRVTIRGNGFKLDVPASPNVYGGTGGVDGTSDMAGKRKPRAFGALVPDPVSGNGGNVTVPLIDPQNLVYQVNDGTVSSIPKVYDSGFALPTLATAGPDADYASYAALIAATIANGHYATCKALGLFRLGSSAFGLITADVLGDATPTYVSDTASIVRRLIFGTTVDLVDESSFAAVTAAQPAAIGYFLGLDDNRSVQAAVDDLMPGIGGWCDFRRDGTLDIGIVVLPVGTPVATYTTVDIIADTLERLELPGDFNPPPKKTYALWGRNWTVQTAVSAGVSPTRMQALKDAYSVAPTTNTSLTATVSAAHKLAQDPEPIPSFFSLLTDGTTEANRQFILKSGGVRSLYSFKVKSKGLIHNIGHVISVTYPRFDLTAGKLLVIVAIEDDTTDKSVTITAFG